MYPISYKINVATTNWLTAVIAGTTEYFLAHETAYAFESDRRTRQIEEMGCNKKLIPIFINQQMRILKTKLFDFTS